MMPVLRNGFVSTFDALAAWWRSRGPGPHLAPSARRAPARVVPIGASARTRAESTMSVHAEEALRTFLSVALDEKRSGPPGETERVAMKPLVDAGSAALSKLEVHAKYLPRRPSMLPKLLSAMANDGSSMRELARIISADPTMLCNLLRVANSVLYRVNDKKIDSLERAVTRVGMDGIRSVIATALMHPVLARGTGWFATFPETIWEQTQLAADAAELHAARLERSDAFNARLLALVHGLATNTVFRIVRDEVLTGRGEALKPAVAQLLDEWTTPIAQRIAQSWDLPAEVQGALIASRDDNALARSLFFGRLAGSQLLMIRRGRIKEFSARAFVLASDSRRKQVDRLWSRLAVEFLSR
jgi:HD-like signal output (HDOD) protein